MSNFKIGDKVRCVNSGGNIYITVGNEYIVRRVFEDCIETSTDCRGYYFEYNPKLFELVEVNQKPADLLKYVIVQGKAEDVVAEVEQYLKQGYKLQGGVSMHQNWFAQALVLNEPC